MAQGISCIKATVENIRSASRGEDILRREHWGGFYYRRSDCGLTIIPDYLFELLARARERNILEMYAEHPRAFGRSDEEFATEVAEWKELGLIGDDFRCHASLVEGDLSHGGVSAPNVTHFAITQACNLRCKHCYIETMARRAPEEITVEELDRTFGQLEAMGSPVVVLAGGEPMCRDDLPEILASLTDHQLDAFLCTNGSLIRESNVEQLVAPIRSFSVSLDGPDAESHEALRGTGQFKRALRGIRLLVEAGAADVAIRVTVTPHNADRLLAFADLAAELGVARVSFKPFGATAEASGVDELVIGQQEYYAAIDGIADRWPDNGCTPHFGDGMPTRPPAWTRMMPPFSCVGGNTSVTVTHDARVVACACVLTPEDWSLREHSFAESWRHSPSIVRWRSLESDGECAACPALEACGGGCRARALGAGLSISHADPWAVCSVDSE
jgi:radical SAM protein with 4Fe4S-binding SPASM domain